MQKLVALITSLLILHVSIVTFAQGAHSVEFFVSNNTATIDMQMAYQRLQGDEQYQLQNGMIGILQRNHLEQGKFENILGAYQMTDSGNITADNTDIFITSPYQYLGEQKIFSMAKQFATVMKQESVAVFIPSQSPMIGELKMGFTACQPSIKEAIALIHERLPSSYSQAYSLHLINEHADFGKVKVAAIEWLGSSVNVRDVENAFPGNNVSFQYGKAYLVYKNGKKESL